MTAQSNAVEAMNTGVQAAQNVGRLAVVRSAVRTLPPREYGGALVVWPGMPFPNLDGRIHHSLVFIFRSDSNHTREESQTAGE